MENLKIKVNGEAESKEAQELFFELGYKWFSGGNQVQHLKQSCSSSFGYLVAWSNGCFTNVIQCGCGNEDAKETTLPELRALVSLHKNPINMDKVLSGVRSDALGLFEDKEYLNKETYEFVGVAHPDHVHDLLIEIPEGAEIYTRYNGGNEFYKSKNGIVYRFDNCCWIETNWDSISEILKECERNNFNVFWKRHTQPEELPFVDDEPSLNDQYAEIEQVRKEYKSNHTGSDLPDFLFEDTVNHPPHYASGEIECIDAMEAMLTPEQFIGYLRGNAFKYQWRYENKGGITDLEKAQWYLNKLISRVG